MSACVCGTPPAVANGEVKYSGSYLNGSKAEYDCDSKYTNAGKDSLLCFADSSCSNPTWIVDSSDSNSGYPDCQAVVPDYDTYNTYNNSSTTGFNSWALFGALIGLLLLLLIAIILMLWYWCCRECCRRCCMKRCPCCRNCCYEVPYGYPPPERVHYHNNGNRRTTTVYHNSNNVQPINRGVAPRKEVVIINDKHKHSQPEPRKVTVTPEKRGDITSPSDVSVRSRESFKSSDTVQDPTKRSQSEPRVVVLQSNHVDRSSPATSKKVVVVESKENRELMPIDEDYYRKHLGYRPNGNDKSRTKSMADIDRNQHKEFDNVNGDKWADPVKLEPRDYVSVEQDKVYKSTKPVDTQGQPLWMPHSSQMRVGANHVHTSTK